MYRFWAISGRLPEIVQNLYMDLRKHHICQLDEKQSIGKRYARMDEAGTPWCFTVDHDTVTDQTVTVRDRDTGEQSRIAIDQVRRFIDDGIAQD